MKIGNFEDLVLLPLNESPSRQREGDEAAAL